MDYAKQLLGKSLRDLLYEDIANYFSIPRTENDLIEFKSFSPKASESQIWEPIYNGVSAFLNSSGGLLVWGAPKALKEGKKEKVFTVELTGIDPKFEKDSIVNKISSSIVPLTSDFKVELLKNSDGKVVCLIEVNESQYKPHQYNHIYYMRLDGQSRPAPHHYVEALFRRTAIPNLEGFLTFGEIHNTTDSRGPRYEFTLTVAIANFSSTQNEENVFYKITSNTPCWNISNWNQNSNPRPENGMKNIVHTEVVTVLANGTPIQKKYGFEFTDHEISTNGADLVFTLQFGGKKSPPKYSKYHLLFIKEPPHLKIIKASNSILIGDVETEELSREAQLNALLER